MNISLSPLNTTLATTTTTTNSWFFLRAISTAVSPLTSSFSKVSSTANQFLSAVNNGPWWGKLVFYNIGLSLTMQAVLFTAKKLFSSLGVLPDNVFDQGSINKNLIDRINLIITHLQNINIANVQIGKYNVAMLLTITALACTIFSVISINLPLTLAFSTMTLVAAFSVKTISSRLNALLENVKVNNKALLEEPLTGGNRKYLLFRANLSPSNLLLTQ